MDTLIITLLGTLALTAMAFAVRRQRVAVKAVVKPAARTQRR